MNPTTSVNVPPANGASTLHDLFALTDEQILEIEPEAQDAAVSRDPWPVTREEKPSGQAQAGSEPAHGELRNASADEKTSLDAQTTANHSSTEHGTRSTDHAPEPPAWLAAQMKDPWTGEEAKELWNGILQAQKEAADYRAAFATPEDARALKELYPGGVNEARAAAERARVLDDFDRAYFGAAGNSAEQTSAARAELAQRMLREDPAAFREMVFAGLHALEDAGKHPGATAVRATLASPGNNGAAAARGGESPAPAEPSLVRAQHAAPVQSDALANEAHVAAYAAFEKAANEDLERAVGATIDRTLNQALPGRDKADTGALRGRLATSIRQDVEAALKGDRQLGEQVAQILSARRLDNETRAQVVRLIGERAQQLVPTAAKRVLNDWTQTTLAAHRGKTERTDTASARREVAVASLTANSSRETPSQASQQEASATRSAPRAVDYRKMSDEQILNL
jgi:hypothetical protein